MRVLHVTSDWKWTGPAEPMLALLRAQRERGDVVALACPEAPADADGVARRARAAGIEPLLALAPGRGLRPARDRADALRLRGALERSPFDVVHVWHDRDHRLAAWARAGLARRPQLVRSFGRAGLLPRAPWSRWLYRRGTDALLCVSPASARANAAACRVPVAGAFGAVDLARFSPRAPDPRLRAALGLPPGARVVGIAARVQRHRRFDLLLAAMARLAGSDPRAHLLLLGRGTHLDELARRPARRLGLAQRVILAGQRRDDYADALRCVDVFTYLVPGSDGGCRALLEAHACGLPSVASRRGAIPEIVADGETGLLVDEEPAALCAAWSALLADPVRRAAMGAAARRRAERCFAPERLAREVEALYRAAGARGADCSSTSSR